MMSDKILFLDVDGVLNSHDWWKRRVASGIRGGTRPDLDPEACARLQTVCDATGAVLVLSSTWRLWKPLPTIKKWFCQNGLTTPLVGRTPDLRTVGDIVEGRYWNDVGRGLEIQWWLRTYLTEKQMNTAHVGIIDDDGDMGDLKKVHVKTSTVHGLTDEELPTLQDVLKQTLAKSEAAGGPGQVSWEIDAFKLRQTKRYKATCRLKKGCTS